MAIRSSFFNSEDGDRKYNAADFAEYFSSLVDTGLFPEEDNSEFLVKSNNNMTVSVGAGQVWVDGYSMINDNDYVLDIETASGSLNRIDRVVIRLDLEKRDIFLDVKRGVTTEEPVAPDLQRDNVIYELGIADITVSKNISEITQDDIKDTRADSELAGRVGSVIAGDITAHEQVRATPDRLGHVKAQTESDGTLIIPDAAPEIKVDGVTIFINEDGELTLHDPNEEILPDSWANVQRIIRRGLAAAHFTIGEVIELNFDGRVTEWIVVGIDHDTPADENLTHSVTLRAKHVLFREMLDQIEPDNPVDDRANYGNNRYIHSNIHQWLNSRAVPFVWEAQHEYDTEFNRASLNQNGFLSKFDEDFAAILSPVIKTVPQPAIDGGGYDEFEATVFIGSSTEYSGRASGLDDTGQSRYQYYAEGGNYIDTTTEDGKKNIWVFRDPRGTRHFAALNAMTGTNTNHSASYAAGIVPMITIC